MFIHTLESLEEFEDYTKQLDENVGLKPETYKEVMNAISKERTKLKNLAISDVSNCKTEPKLGKLETELGKLQEVHGEIVKYFDVHSGCDSFKFKDGAVYRVKLERSLGKATLD
jgi:hypothetical protein